MRRLTGIGQLGGIPRPVLTESLKLKNSDQQPNGFEALALTPSSGWPGHRKRPGTPMNATAAKKQKLQEERVRRRAVSAMEKMTPQGEHQTWLEAQAVQKPTAKNYNMRVEWALEHLRFHGGSWREPHLVDQVLAECREELSFDGYGGGEASRLIAAWQDRFPEYGRQGMWSLPHAQRAAKGFRRLAPTRSRLPLPLAFACAIAMVALAEGEWLEAVAWLVMFVAYLRPSELLTLESQHIVPPPPRDLGAGVKHVSILVRPMESRSSVPSKTGRFDDSVLLDQPYLPELSIALLRVARQRPVKSLLFPWKYTELAARLRLRVLSAGLDPAVITSYCFRHGGPSHDVSTGLRSLTAVLKRGRWSSIDSVKRYEKGGRIHRALADAAPETQRFVAASLAQLGQVLLGSRQPLRAPLPLQA